MSEVKTPIEMLYKWEGETPDLVYLRQSLGEGNWSELSWAEVGDRVRRLAAYIQAKNYAPQTNIVIWSSNSADWIIGDLAIMLAGHVSVPLYFGQAKDSVRHIFEETEAPLVLLGPCGQEVGLDEILPAGVERIGLYGATAPCETHLEEIIKTVERFEGRPTPDPDALMTLVYSSGTTGKPKGVMHAHGTPGIVVAEQARTLDMSFYDGDASKRARFFSYLPLSHMAERAVLEMPSLYLNAVISVSAGLDHFAQEMQSVQPTFFLAVPRLWSKFKAGLEAKIPAAAIPSLDEPTKAAIRAQLGLSQATFIMTGSAPVSLETQKYFLGLGIVLREGYGATETFATGTSWSIDEEATVGSVGHGNGTAQVEIAEDGEILMRTQGVMMGYYKNPEKTAEVLVDGFYRTGDLGKIDDNGNLWITGRVGDVFKTSKGKFVHPKEVEKHFDTIEEFEQLILVGRGLEQPVIIATLTEIGHQQDRDELDSKLSDALAAINPKLANFERVERVCVSSTEWTVDNGFLTPTLKQKRATIEAYYRDHIATNESQRPVHWLDI